VDQARLNIPAGKSIFDHIFQEIGFF